MFTNIDQWLNLTKNMNLPLNEINQKSSDLCKQTAEINLQLINDQYSRFTNQLKRLSNVRKPEDFFALQTEFLNENIANNIKTAQQLSNIAMENIHGLEKIWGDVVTRKSHEVVEKTKKFTKKAKKRK